ncbi:CBS domain-containing protein [Sediminibacterium sp. C3]|uniref:CBS domain-containing protein n=1 Tax=Sediminibacterium sp. C3 TaxID=1267211 RepID=UPI0003F5DDA3|nr:CBS domain-containing protein [Sediminibacterium sp. C3]
MHKVSDILNRKGTQVTVVAPDTTVIEALRVMAEKNIGSVVVMDKERFLGILTERDYSRKVILMGRHSSDTPVSEIMSADFPSITLTDTVEHCMQLMSSRRIRYLPVMQNDQLAGIISMNDLVAETILSQQQTITQLENYLQS